MMRFDLVPSRFSRWSREPVIAALRSAGVTLNGSGPCDIRVSDDAFFDAIASRGLTGAREAYVDGHWETGSLDELTYRLLRSNLGLSWASRGLELVKDLRATVRNLQDARHARRAGTHYNLGNDLFEAMLDPRMIYSCAYWKTAETLDAAQEAKLDLVCRKVGLGPGMRVLDIGCGWGGFARFAAERYGVSVVGVTVSENQAELARATCRGLPVEIRVADYRTLRDERVRFDAIVSIGMFEHVGHKNYRQYMELASGLLEADGLFLLHTIGGNRSKVSYDVWMNENVFPDAMLPSAAQIAQAVEGLFVIEDWHTFGADYDRTLMAWFERFDRAWPALRGRYDERFYRVWKCYLLTCAGSFRARLNQLWQVVLSAKGTVGGYKALR